MNLAIFHAAVNARSYPYKCTNILLNVPSNASSDTVVKSTGKAVEMLNPPNMILDSGGNTLYCAEKAGKEILSDPDQPLYKGSKKRLNLAPEHVILAAEALKPTAVVALDFPLQKTTGEIDVEFEKKLPINLQFARETASLREKHVPEVSLLIPVQARDPEQFEEFMKGLSGLTFTGISLPNRNLKPDLLVHNLTRLSELGVPWVHILGTTNFTNIGVAAYFARQKLIEFVSMDSRSWSSSGKSSGFLSPHNLLNHKINENTWIPESLRNDCPCPFCRNVSFEDMTFDLYHSRSALLSSHNAWVTEMVARQLYKNAKTLDQLTDYMMRKKSKHDWKVKRAMDALAATIGN